MLTKGQTLLSFNHVTGLVALWTSFQQCVVGSVAPTPSVKLVGQWRSQDIADARAQSGQTRLFAKASARSAEPFREVWSMLSQKPFAASQVGSKAILW